MNLNIINAISEINWLAVELATLTYCAFSGVWHKQFAFGKKWENAMGFDRPDYWGETNIYFIVPFISCLVATVAMHIIVNLTNVATFKEAITLGLISGIGLATTTTFTNAVIPTMKKPLVFGAITGTAHAIGITLATIIIYAIAK